MAPETKTCQSCKAEFTIEAEDFSYYEKIKVPPPTWCKLCRFQRRMIFRNERKLFRAVSGLSGKPILSLYPTSAGYTLYTSAEWHSDVWDPADYGQDVDFTRPFLLQVFELNRRVPKPANSDINMINSEYSTNASNLKNCYLLFNSNYTEDSAYGNGVDKCRNCYDNSHLQECERCYGSFWLTKCYETHFSSRCEDCSNVWFSKDCRGCSNCVGCVNLRAKKYCIFNEQYTKEEYEAKLKEIRFDAWSGLSKFRDEAKEFWLKFPNKFLQGIQNVNVSGEYIANSKNVRESYLIRHSEDLKYCQYSQVPSSKDCYDCTLIGCMSDLLFECSVCGWGGSNIKFCFECWSNARDMEYSLHCQSSSNLFGCSGMRNKQYCILNKQYSKEEFFALREKVVEHMNAMPYVDSQGREYRYGEFFPPEFSPLGYADTIAPEHFPLSKEEALARGFKWEERNPAEYETTIEAGTLPDDIKDISEDILKEIIKCEKCGRAYRLILPELQFLKQIGIAAPRTCVDCRHADRISQRNRAIFYDRTCACSGDVSANDIYKNSAKHFHGSEACPNRVRTSYSPDRPEIVYCEQCYQAEVI